MIFRNLIFNNCWRRRKILQTRAYAGRGSASTSPLNWGRSPPFLELRAITHFSNLKLRSEEHTKNSLQCCNLIFPFKYKEICLKERWNSTCKVIELYVYLVPDIQEAKCSEFTVQTWKNLERIVQFTMINYQQGGSGGLAPPPLVQIPV